MADYMTLSSDLSDQYREHFENQLLTYAVQATRKAEFGQKAPLPKGVGSKQISFFKYGAPNAGQIKDLTDASADETLASTVYQPIDVFSDTAGDSVPNASGVRQLSLTKVTATLQQIGQVVVISDVLNNTEFLNSLAQATRTNGEDAALKCDNIVKAELSNATTPTGENNTEGGNTIFAGDADNVVGLDSVIGNSMTASSVLDAVTELRIKRAPEINGGYVCIAAPQVLRDVMRDDDWLAAATRSNVSALYNGEAGSLYGVRFVEDTNPFRCALGAIVDIDTDVATGDVFASFFLGGEAFGVPALSGDSPMSPSIQIVDTPDKKDPLNQVITVGFKTMYTAKVLTSDYYIRMFSRAGFVGIDAAG
jgi:N4-gp56 family major capsid protein